MAEVRKLKQKEKCKVGFEQTESNNPWRIAQTKSMKESAEKLGYQPVYTGPAGSAAKQVADVNSMSPRVSTSFSLHPTKKSR